MRVVSFTFLVYLLAYTKGEKAIENEKNIPEEILLRYKPSHYDFVLDMFRVLFEKGHKHFLFSPLSLWLMLSAVSEGTYGTTQAKLREMLKLPEDLKTRMEYYKIATSCYLPDSDVDIFSARTFVVEKSLLLNDTWEKIVVENSLMDIVRLPIKDDPEAVQKYAMKKLSLELPKLDLSGNSLFLDAVDYSGLWTEAFSDAVVERSPFFDQAGNRIGAVDLMRTIRHVRLGYIPEIDLKYIELPIGEDQRYRFVFAIALDPLKFAPFLKYNGTDSVNLLNGLRWTEKPLEVAIPRVKLTSTVDLRSLMDGLGDLWTDGEATSLISNPPALPSSFVQRATLTLNNAGIEPAAIDIELGTASKGLDLDRENSFVADRPFLFGLLDAQTSTCIIASQYTEPTYVD